MTTIPCPKCKSRSTHISVSRHAWLPEPDEILVCTTCGMRVYGRDRVGALRQQVEAAARREEEIRAAERAALLAAAQRERAEREDEQKRAAAIRRAARIEAEILRNAKCAWPPCENDHTMTSRYCSRTCSNKNAHAREKAKKEAAKTAGQPSPCPAA